MLCVLITVKLLFQILYKAMHMCRAVFVLSRDLRMLTSDRS